jgi:hypothetical protein
MFNDEFDMLDIHLAITDSYVDRWIILEGNRTWSGIPKPYYLLNNLDKYAKYGNRIQLISLNIPDGYINWQCENYSRASLQQGIDCLDDEDIIYNFELIEDYSIYEHNSKQIQFIGGATSIDRSKRMEGISYWSGEGLNFNKDKLRKVDTLVTHTAPPWCFPKKFNKMVYDWAKDDSYLLEELILEREVMGEIFKVCQPSLHLYGHFHDSWNKEINDCKHILLNINEIWSMI